MKKRIVDLLVIISVVLLSFSLFIFIDYSSENREHGEINENAVLDVIDGYTFKLGNGEIVRLICVDAPEKGKKGYEEAKEFLSFLLLNKEVRLEKDVSDKDQYGRLLRYVYINDSENPEIEIFVNKEIVKEGYGVVWRYGNDTKRCGEIAGGEEG